MPKFVAPEKLRAEINEPIEFTLAGKDFVLPCVPLKLFPKMAALKDSENPGESILRALVGDAEYDTIEDRLDIREVKLFLDWFTALIGQQESTGEPEKN
jgi:hypothetical protein